jgi:Fe-S-cluster-containing dehydrogenase component
MKAFVIDVGRCNGCFGCQFVCKDEHVGNDWAPIAKPQPDAGQFWMRLDEHICGTVPKVRMHYIANPCMHCDNAACMAACKVEGAIYKRDDGMVVIDTDVCTGCKACVDACPYHSIYFNEDLNLAQKCTGCAHLLDDEEWEYPRCVDSCPTQAIKFAEESELAELIARAEVLKPEAGTKPRVYYLNIPKKFIAGTVYDPIEKEVVVGASVTATAADGTAGAAVTDGFGDFWIEGLASGEYEVSIEADGFEARVFEIVDTTDDVNLGDVALTALGSADADKDAAGEVALSQ